MRNVHMYTHPCREYNALSYLKHLTSGDVPRFDASVGARSVKDLARGIHGHASHSASVTFENL